jgi:hypothetical protein
MSELCTTAAVAATNAAAASCREELPPKNSGNILPQAEWFALMARERWQFKAPAALADLIGDVEHGGYGERTYRAWSSAANEPPARALAILLRSNEGDQVLDWIMRDDPPNWWLGLEIDRRKAALFDQARDILAQIP